MKGQRAEGKGKKGKRGEHRDHVEEDRYSPH
jgi:hypothetical protein